MFSINQTTISCLQRCPTPFAQNPSVFLVMEYQKMFESFKEEELLEIWCTLNPKLLILFSKTSACCFVDCIGLSSMVLHNFLVKNPTLKTEKRPIHTPTLIMKALTAIKNFCSSIDVMLPLNSSSISFFISSSPKITKNRCNN